MARETSLTSDELALTADVIGAIGTSRFYHCVLRLLDERIQCERRLVMKYSRYAMPEFVLNTSLDAEAVGVYLAGLYRLDPLLRLVTNDSVRPVVTFREIRLIDHENSFYDKIFQSGQIYDELAITLPTMGGAYVALCFDRESSEFGGHESNWANLLFPVLRQAHDVHVKTALLSGLNSLFGGGRVGILTVAEDGKIVYRNDSWSRVANGVSDEAIVSLTLGKPAGSPSEIGNCIGHWEYLDPRDAPVASYRTVFLEERSAGYIDQDVPTVLKAFNQSFLLSPRETQILEKMMRGYPTDYISAKLGLTSGTVKNYKRRLYEKLDIKSEREIFPLFINHLFGSSERQSAGGGAAKGLGVGPTARPTSRSVTIKGNEVGKSLPAPEGAPARRLHRV
jgi:DNA-binding CsgD family transcriptional regulator